MRNRSHAGSQQVLRDHHRDDYKEHGPPHFHAKYAGQTGVFSISDLKLTEGCLPKRVIALILEWAFEHRDELMENWELAEAKKPLRSIQPLE